MSGVRIRSNSVATTISCACRMQHQVTISNVEYACVPDSERFRAEFWLQNGTSSSTFTCPSCGDVIEAKPFRLKPVRNAVVPEKDRMVVYMHPKEERVYVPGVSPIVSGRPMPDHLARAGYNEFHVDTIQDMDKVDRVRAHQTGHETFNEMNFDPVNRDIRRNTPESDDPTRDIV